MQKNSCKHANPTRGKHIVIGCPVTEFDLLALTDFFSPDQRLEQSTSDITAMTDDIFDKLRLNHIKTVIEKKISFD